MLLPPLYGRNAEMTRTRAERVMIYTTIPEYGVTSCIEYQYCFNSTFSGIVSTIKCEKHHGANKAESQLPLECRGECSHGATGMELRTDGPGSVGASGLEDSDWSPAQLCLLVVRTITKSTYGYTIDTQGSRRQSRRFHSSCRPQSRYHQIQSF